MERRRDGAAGGEDGWLDGEDFGQRSDLTDIIRNILRDYPPGATIYKELLQNADDAGARTVSFCLDLRRHGSDTLLSPAMAPFQGVSLLVHNDAVFTDDDFVSITVRPPRCAPPCAR